MLPTAPALVRNANDVGPQFSRFRDVPHRFTRPGWASASNETVSTPLIGLVTRTLAQPSIVRFAFVAALAEERHLELALINDDTVSVYRFGLNYHPEPAAAPFRFGSSIRAACVVSLAAADRLGGVGRPGGIPSPQAIALTLQSGDLVLFWCVRLLDGSLATDSVSVSIPRPANLLRQLGKLIATDPNGRCVAVASTDVEVGLFQFSDSPSSVFGRIIQLELPGPILQLAFLHTADDDEADTAIVAFCVSRGNIVARFQRWNDWVSEPVMSGWLSHSVRMASQPRFLIPVAHPYAFLLVNDQDILFCPNAAADLPEYLPVSLDGVDQSSVDSAATSVPIWTGWAPVKTDFGPKSKPGVFSVYLGREDGLVVMIQVDSDLRATVEFGEQLSTPIKSAADCFGATSYDGTARHYLVVPPSTGIGCIFNRSVSHNAISGFDLVEALPAWGPVLSATGYPPGRAGLLVTTGRQPFGAVTEPRFGLELRLGACIRSDQFVAATSVWSFIDSSEDRRYCLVSNPRRSYLVRIGLSPADSVFVQPAHNCRPIFECPTIAAGQLGQRHFIHVTANAIHVGQIANGLEYRLHASFGRDRVSAVAIHSFSLSAAVAVQIDGVTSATKPAHVVRLLIYNCKPSGDVTFRSVETSVVAEVSAISLEVVDGGWIIIAATVAGDITIFWVDQSASAISTLVQLEKAEVLVSSHAAHSIGLIRATCRDLASPVSRAVVVVSRRSGGMVAYPVQFRSSQVGKIDVVAGPAEVVSSQFRQPIRFTRGSSLVSFAAYGGTLFRFVSRTGVTVDIEAVYTTDAFQPEANSSPIAHITVLPAQLTDPDPYAGAIASLSGGCLLIGRLDPRPKFVPRRVPVPGSPSRVVYSHFLNAILVGSLQATPLRGSGPSPTLVTRGVLAALAPTAPPAGKHSSASGSPGLSNSYVHPHDRSLVISRSATADSVIGTFEFKPGERVSCLREWIVKLRDGRPKCLIVVGTHITPAVSDPSPPSGRLLILQGRRSTHGEVVMKVVKAALYSDPIFAVDVFGNDGILYSAGSMLKIMRVSVDDRTAVTVQTLPVRSIPFAIKIRYPLAYVSTSSESTFVYRIPPISVPESTGEENEQIPNHGLIDPYADIGHGQMPYNLLERPPLHPPLHPLLAREREIDMARRHILPMMSHEQLLRMGLPERLQLVYSDVAPRDTAAMLPIKLKDHFPDQPIDTLRFSSNILFVADKTGSLTGLWEPSSQMLRGQCSSIVAFSARLRRTLSSLISTRTRPGWNGWDRHRTSARYFSGTNPPGPEDVAAYAGIVADDLAGVSVDGSIVAMSVVNKNTWRLLKVVENVMRASDWVDGLVRVGRTARPDWSASSTAGLQRAEADLMTDLSLLDPVNDPAALGNKTDFHIDGDIIAALSTGRGQLRFCQAIGFDGVENAIEVTNEIDRLLEHYVVDNVADLNVHIPNNSREELLMLEQPMLPFENMDSLLKQRLAALKVCVRPFLSRDDFCQLEKVWGLEGLFMVLDHIVSLVGLLVPTGYGSPHSDT